MHYFVCGTNRPEVGRDGRSLEALMHDNHCAAMWEYPEDREERVRILEHMGRVEPGDLIFMFATGVGVIGIGKATKSRLGPLQPGDGRRIRGDSWRAPEWQVPVEWVRWQPDNPCEVTGWNATFYEVTGDTWDGLRKAVIQHFNLG
jgi:hypothetical protein